MTKYAPPPSLAEAFDELKMLPQISDDEILLGVCTENFIRVDVASESPKLAE
jgi:hypothetical protein